MPANNPKPRPYLKHLESIQDALTRASTHLADAEELLGLASSFCRLTGDRQFDLDGDALQSVRHTIISCAFKALALNKRYTEFALVSAELSQPAKPSKVNGSAGSTTGGVSPATGSQKTGPAEGAHLGTFQTAGPQTCIRADCGHQLSDHDREGLCWSCVGTAKGCVTAELKGSVTTFGCIACPGLTFETSELAEEHAKAVHSVIPLRAGGRS